MNYHGIEIADTFYDQFEDEKYLINSLYEDGSIDYDEFYNRMMEVKMEQDWFFSDEDGF